MKQSTGLWKAFGVLILAVVLMACQGKAATEEGESDNLEGSVKIDGSGTVYPLMAKLAEDYMVNEQEGVSVEVSRSGTGAGFEKFLDEDGTNFNDASRPIKEEEEQKADDLNMEVKELKVALDGLTFVIHKDNDWATEMTQEELKDIFLAEEGVTKWSDINADWPDEEIHTYGPNENHGTYEFFYETVLEEKDLKADINLQQDYSTLVNLVANDEHGIAFFGFGYYVNNQDELQAIQVDFGDGPVEPTLDTIAEDGDYAPFTRPVFTYLNVDHAKENPQVLDFGMYVLHQMNEVASDTGFAPIPEDEVQENLDFLKGLK